MAELRKPGTKCILVTGVTKGLGLALAKRFAKDGHVILGCGRSADQIDKLASELGDRHDFQTLDVTDITALRQWRDRLVAKKCLPDFLISNAGMINRSAMLWQVQPEEFEKIVDVNIKGVFNVIHCFLPAMIQAQRGVVINLSSGWGRSTSPEVAPYCATKWAVEGLTRALAQELPEGMAAVPLNPGIIHTSMLESAFGESASAYPEPEEWAAIAAPFILGLGPKDNGRPLTVR